MSKNAELPPIIAVKFGAPVNDMESILGNVAGSGFKLNIILSWVKHTALSASGLVNILTFGIPFTVMSVVSAALHPVATSAYTMLYTFCPSFGTTMLG